MSRLHQFYVSPNSSGSFHAPLFPLFLHHLFLICLIHSEILGLLVYILNIDLLFNGAIPFVDPSVLVMFSLCFFSCYCYSFAFRLSVCNVSKLLPKALRFHKLITKNEKPLCCYHLLFFSQLRSQTEINCALFGVCLMSTRRRNTQTLSHIIG